MRVITIAACLIIFYGATALCEPLESSKSPFKPPACIDCLRVKPALNFCGEVVPLDNQDIRDRLEKEIRAALWNREQINLWIKRSGRYFPYIEKMLRLSNMPEDLKYIAVAESALLPDTSSAKGATGIWQFIKSTGMRYGLTVNSNIDERRNVFLSTGAAIRYLRVLHKHFNSWTLAAAAYNMGEERLKMKIRKQNVRDYYALGLPVETQQYILKIIAAKMILSNPEKYGFVSTEDDLSPPRQIDRIDIDRPRNTPLHVVTRAADTRYRAIKGFNSEFSESIFPKGTHSLFIPGNPANNFQAQYDKFLSQWMSDESGMIYTVKKGDNLSAIASQFNVPLLSLYNWNELNGNDIYPGNRLLIYTNKWEIGESGQD